MKIPRNSGRWPQVCFIMVTFFLATLGYADYSDSNRVITVTVTDDPDAEVTQDGEDFYITSDLDNVTVRVSANGDAELKKPTPITDNVHEKEYATDPKQSFQYKTVIGEGESEEVCEGTICVTKGPYLLIERTKDWDEVTDANSDADGIARPSPDNTVEFTATIFPPTETGKIKFELIEMSTEPGTNMNTGDGTEKDASFEEQDGFDAPPSGGQSITEDDDSDDDNTATVVLTSHDFAPYGKIKASIVGEDVESEEITILIDEEPEDGNDIEDAWDDAVAASESGTTARDDDEDDQPEGDKSNGDLLPRYEEYRGFTAMGVFRSTDPATKTVFLKDDLGHEVTDDGGGLLDPFAGLGSEMVMVQDGEHEADRQINANGGASEQRVIIVEASNQTGGKPGQTLGNRPSTYTYCRVYVDQLTATVDLRADGGATIFYDGDSETHGNANWSWIDDGSIRINEEEITYDEAHAPGTALDSIETAEHAAAVADTTIIINHTSTGGSIVHFAIGAEIIRSGRETSGRTGFTNHGAIAVDAGQIVTTATSLPRPPGGGAYYASIGAEWISYTGTMLVDNKLVMTGVNRGVLGTAAAVAAHGDGTAMHIPAQLAGCARGLFGTAAAAIPVGSPLETLGVFIGCDRAEGVAHAAGDDIEMFVNVDNVIRMTASHEAAHAADCGSHRNNSIMQSSFSRGATEDNGLFLNFTEVSQGQFNAH